MTCCVVGAHLYGWRQCLKSFSTPCTEWAVPWIDRFAISERLHHRYRVVLVQYSLALAEPEVLGIINLTLSVRHILPWFEDLERTSSVALAVFIPSKKLAQKWKERLKGWKKGAERRHVLPRGLAEASRLERSYKGSSRESSEAPQQELCYRS